MVCAQYIPRTAAAAPRHWASLRTCKTTPSCVLTKHPGWRGPSFVGRDESQVRNFCAACSRLESIFFDDWDQRIQFRVINVQAYCIDTFVQSYMHACPTLHIFALQNITTHIDTYSHAWIHWIHSVHKYVSTCVVNHSKKLMGNLPMAGSIPGSHPAPRAGEYLNASVYGVLDICTNHYLITLPYIVG